MILGQVFLRIFTVLGVQRSLERGSKPIQQSQNKEKNEFPSTITPKNRSQNLSKEDRDEIWTLLLGRLNYLLGR